MNSPIKWHGAKNNHSHYLVQRFGCGKYYYEPFLGGGSALLKALEFQSFEEYIVSDIDKNLIEVWKTIQDNYRALLYSYEENYLKVKQSPEHYYNIREQFNLDYDPAKFFFLSRVCIGSRIRYDKDGNFIGEYNQKNIPISPENLEKILEKTNYLLSRNNVSFYNCSWDQMEFNQAGATIYFDPPTNLQDFGDFVGKLIYLKQTELYTYFITVAGSPRVRLKMIMPQDVWVVKRTIGNIDFYSNFRRQ